MNLSSSAKLTIASNFLRISSRIMPRIAPFRKMFSRPVSSGWKPVPTSSRLDTRPSRSMCPRVGGVIRERIFSSVLFPAPLGPMMPTTSPTCTSKLTSCSAQNSAVSSESWPASRRSRRNGAPTSDTSDSRNCVVCCVRPIAYFFATPLMAMAGLDDIGEPALDGAEVAEGDGEQHSRAGKGDPDQIEGQRASEDRVTEADDHAYHRVQRVEQPPPRGDDVEGIEHRRREQPELDHERDDVAEVAVAHHQRGEERAGGCGKDDGAEDEDRNKRDLW